MQDDGYTLRPVVGIVNSQLAILQKNHRNNAILMVLYICNQLGGNFMSTTGEKIKYLRKQRGISAEKLAKELKVSPATIYRYENGDIEKMPTSTISSIASLLGTTPSYLMGWDSDNNSKLTKERPKVRSLARRMDKLSDDDLDLINDLLDKFDK